VARALAPFGRPAARREVGRPVGTLAGARSSELATLLRDADGGSRRRLVGELQERHGNAGVASMLSSMAVGMNVMDAWESLTDGVSSFLGADEEPQTEEELPIPTSSGTQIVVNESPFDVSGTFKTVAEQLEARSEAASVTSQFADIYFEPAEADPITLANVTVLETLSLPNWKDRPQANEREKTEWDRFRAALAAHEAKHLQIDKAEFTDIHKKLLRKTHDKANAEIDAAEARATVTNDEFDAETRNGKLAGTTIDISVAEPREEKKKTPD
jgi:hypothetical protein